jgi:signal transduction histidine kinase
MDQLNSLTSLIAALTFLFTGAYLLLGKDNRQVRLATSFYFFSLGTWGLGIFGLVSSQQPLELFLRILATGVVFMPPTFLKFCYSLDNSGGEAVIQKQNKKLKGAFAVSIFLCLLGIFTNILYVGVKKVTFGYVGDPGPGFLLFLALLLFCITNGLIFLYKTARRTSGNQKAILKGAYYLFWFFWVGALSVLPTLQGTIILGGFPIWNFTNILYGLLIAFLITKFQILDISVVINKTAAFVTTVAIFSGLYFLFVVPYRMFVTTEIDLIFLLSTLIFMVLMGLRFERIRLFIQTTAEKKFLKGRYDYKEVLLKFSTALSETSELKQILDVVNNLFKNEIEVSDVYMFLPAQYSQDTNIESDQPPVEGMFLWSTNTQTPTDVHILPNHILLKTLADNPHAVKDTDNIPRELKTFFEDNQAALMVPCIRLSTLEGIFVFHPKLTEEDYSAEDLQLLKTLSIQMATALNRIKPFEQIKKDYQKSIAFAEKASQQATFAKLTMGIAHEIRNPITILKSSAKLLERLWTFSPISAQDLAFAVGGDIDRANDLLKDLITLDYLDSQVMPTKKMDVTSRRFAFELPEVWNPYKEGVLAALTVYYKHVELHRFFDLVYKSVSRVVDIAETMLKYGRADSKDRQLMPINNVMRDLVIMVEGEVNKRGIVLEEHFYDFKEMIFGDETRLNQALINATMNAMQALEKVPEGKRTLRLKTAPAQFMNAAGIEVKGLQISIEDTGCGISEDHLAKIYDPFFSTKDKSGGKNVGLGLSILQQIIKDHDGVIEVQSKVNEGTQFKISLPFAMVSGA